MKNFLDLLATELTLDVCINDQSRTVGLHDFLTFDETDSVAVDGIEILPRYSYLAINGQLIINEPFYCWHHRVSAQGWLLTPH